MLRPHLSKDLLWFGIGTFNLPKFHLQQEEDLQGWLSRLADDKNKRYHGRQRTFLRTDRKTTTLLRRGRLGDRKQAAPTPAGEEESVTDDAGAAELAAWTLVCRVVMNLDETVTKQ